NAAQRRNREAAALHLGRCQLAVTRQAGEFGRFTGNIEDALLVGIANHRYHQTVRGIGCKTDVVVLLEHQRVAVERGIEFRELLERGHHSLDEEGQHGDLDARLGLRLLFVQILAELFQFGDIGHVVVRDVGNHDPVAVQVGTRNLLDARQRTRFDFAEFGEIDLGPWQHAQAAFATHRYATRSRNASPLSERLLDVIANVVGGNALFGTRTGNLTEVDTQLAGKLAYRRRRVWQRAQRHVGAGKRVRGRMALGRCRGQLTGPATDDRCRGFRRRR